MLLRKREYFFISICPLIIWAAIPSNPEEIIINRKSQTILILFGMSLFGTLFFIILTKILFGQYSGSWSEFYENVYIGEEMKGFERVLTGKYNNTPYVISVIQCWATITFLKHKLNAKNILLIFSLMLLTTSIAVLSNLRAVILAWSNRNFSSDLFFLFD